MLTTSVRARMLLTSAALLVFSCMACQRYSENPPLDEMTRNISKDVAVVGQTSSAGSGAPVLVLEETHNSRASLIEHAIILTRLYAGYGVRDIALEAYLQDGSKIDARWFTDRPNTSAVDRARVAVRLLKEGEISAPEFAKLVYANVNLIPDEISSQYKVKMSEGALDAAVELAQRISPSGICQARMCRTRRRGAPNRFLHSKDQNRLVFRRSMTSLPRPLITAFIMKRLKPFTWSSLIDGGSASSWRSTTTSTRAGPRWLSA